MRSSGRGRVDEQDFGALEQALRHQVLEITAQVMAQRFNADDSDHSGSTTACACGQTARYAGRRPKTFTSVLGPLTLERAYYYCDACRTGICPRDRALGLHATSLSPGVLRMVGLAASDFSFAAASDLLWELAAVRVETKQVERAAEALGREVAADERDVAETVPSPAPTMYLGLDGTGVPVRPTEVEGRRGKQPDGSAKTREVKLATLWTPEGRDKAGRPVRDRGSVSYNAAVESAASRDNRPVAVRLRPTCLSRGATARLRHRGPPGRHRRRRPLALGASPTSSFPAPSKSSTSTTPSSICATWPRPSTAPAQTWPTSGSGTGVPSWMPAGSAPSSPRCAPRPRPRPRREGAFTMCSGTDTACAIRSSAPRACASLRASSRPAASRSAHGSSAPACAGPSPAPTPSSPCAAASSAAASRTSGSDEPHTPPEGASHNDVVHPGPDERIEFGRDRGYERWAQTTLATWLAVASARR